MINYLDLVEETVVIGDNVPSRMGLTYERLGVQVRTDAHTLVHRKGINYRLGWMEMLQLIAGIYDPDQLQRVAPNADHSLFTGQMAYGPRVRSTLSDTVETLRVDAWSRQAVLYIGDPKETGSANLPCTLTYQFRRHYGTLNGIVTMRSWDLIKGLAYDLIMFGGLLQVVADCLRLSPGILIVTAGSAHVYEADLLKQPTTKTAKFYLDPFHHTVVSPPGTLAQWRAWAQLQVYDEWPAGGIPGGVVVSDPNNIVRRLSRETVNAPR